MRYKELDKNRWSKVQNFENREEAYKEIKKSVAKAKKK
jgi:inorganic pyrophosphatase